MWFIQVTQFPIKRVEIKMESIVYDTARRFLHNWCEKFYFCPMLFKNVCLPFRKLLQLTDQRKSRQRTLTLTITVNAQDHRSIL